MGFKKQNWINYCRKGTTAKLEIFDEDGRSLDKSKWTISDKESERKIFTIFKNKYGVFKKPTISPENSINAMNQFNKDMGIVS